MRNKIWTAKFTTLTSTRSILRSESPNSRLALSVGVYIQAFNFARHLKTLTQKALPYILPQHYIIKITSLCYLGERGTAVSASDSWSSSCCNFWENNLPTFPQYTRLQNGYPAIGSWNVLMDISNQRLTGCYTVMLWNVSWVCSGVLWWPVGGRM